MWYDYFPCWLVGHRYGQFHEGFQYCSRCGIGRPAPCAHRWEPFEKWTSPNKDAPELKGRIVYVFKCAVCGELRQDEVF